jgi:hypothetical protein
MKVRCPQCRSVLADNVAGFWLIKGEGGEVLVKPEGVVGFHCAKCGLDWQVQPDWLEWMGRDPRPS